MNLNRFFRIIHPDKMKPWAIFAPIAFIGLVTVNHYGISIDEHVHLLILKWNWELIQEGKPIPVEGLQFYGIVFDGAAELFFQIKHWLETHLLGRTPWVPYFSANNPEIMTLDRFLTKHVFTFFVSLIAYLSVAGGVTLLSSKKWAWLAPLILALCPRFWGKSFFDPKDIPFAALFSLCIYLGTYWIERINRDASPPVIFGIQRQTVLAIAYGVVVGLLSGIRLGGFIILVFLGLVEIVLILRHPIGRSLKYLIVNYSLIIFSWGITVFCLTPAAWSNPFHWFWEAIGYLSNHEWSGSVLFKGKIIKASELPWDYLPTWFLIATPSLFLCYFWLGLIGLIRNYHQFSDRQKAYSLLVILQIFMLPTVAIVKGSTLYDGLRHFLFVIPGMAVVTTFGFIWLYQQLDRPKFKRGLVAVTVLGMAIVLFDMVTLHPYEYVYFNRVFGRLKAAQGQYETDYWALSMREGMEWINQNGKQDAVVVVPQSWYVDTARPFANPDLTVMSKERFKDTTLEMPDYFLYFNRNGWFKGQFPNCDVVHSVTRQGVPLARVKDCQATNLESS